MSKQRVEILYFQCCSKYESARSSVERAAAELGADPEIRLVEVANLAEAERLRFLGSPTIRVNGRDVEPGADGRRDYAFSCRVYQTVEGIAGEPPDDLIRRALSEVCDE